MPYKGRNRWKPVKYGLAAVPLPCVDGTRIHAEERSQLSLKEPELSSLLADVIA
jgi:hypothetical protein